MKTRGAQIMVVAGAFAAREMIGSTQGGYGTFSGLGGRSAFSLWSTRPRVQVIDSSDRTASSTSAAAAQGEVERAHVLYEAAMGPPRRARDIFAFCGRRLGAPARWG